MTRKKRREMERQRSKKQLTTEWKAYLHEHSLLGDQYAEIAAMVLEDPDECDIRWFQDVITALEECRNSDSYVWRKYVGYLQGHGNPLHYEDIRSALSVYRRHKLTHYDDDLRSGCDQATARILSNRELEDMGLPLSRDIDESAA